MPVLLLLFSWFGQECECPEAGCAKGGGAASGNKPRLSSVFEWIRVRVAPCAVRRGGGNGFARPAGQPGCRCPGLPGRESVLKLPLSPDLCASRVLPLQPLPPACRRVYSSPSRRTPDGAAARTPRTGYCGRRRRSDRPFRTGFIRWLAEGRVLSQAPVFHEFLESIYFQTYKVLFWTASSILAQDERWRRA